MMYNPGGRLIYVVLAVEPGFRVHLVIKSNVHFLENLSAIALLRWLIL